MNVVKLQKFKCLEDGASISINGRVVYYKAASSHFVLLQLEKNLTL